VNGVRGLAAALLLCALSGCNLVSGGVKVEPVAVSTQKPGNVALYVAVSKHGNGVIGLQKTDFKVYENGFPLDNDQIKLTLLSTNASTSRHAAVLVDMSKALKREERKSLADALRPFIARLRQREPVSLYAFDGAEKAHLVQEYAQQDTRAEPDEKDTSMEHLLQLQPQGRLHQLIQRGDRRCRTAERLARKRRSSGRKWHADRGGPQPGLRRPR